VWLPPLFSLIASGSGTWATHAVVPANAVHRLPSGKEEVSQFSTALITAQQLLDDLPTGAVVLQNGGSSFTSLAVSAFAKESSTRVFTIASDTDRLKDATTRHKACDSLVFADSGAGYRALEHALVSSSNNRAAVTRILNSVGGRSVNRMLPFLRTNGQMLNYGAQNGFGLMFAPSHQIYKQLTFSGFYFPKWFENKSYDERQKLLERALEAASSKNVKAQLLTYPVKVANGLEDVANVWDNAFVKGGEKGVIKF